MKKKNIWCAILLLAVSGLIAQAAEFTTTIISSADTWIQNATATHGSDNYMNIYGSGTNYPMGYVRFNLSGLGIANVLDASLKMTVSGNAARNDNLVTGRYGLHGLNNVAGNTPQNWDEAALNQSNTGAEVDWTSGTVVMTNVTNLDSDDATGTTETIVADPAGAWAAGTTITTTGIPLVSFLQSRVEDNGLVTFIIRQDAGGDRGYGLCTKEHATEEWRPVLTLTYKSGGASYPQPANGATVNRDVLTQLSWTNDPNILKCDVYFGTEPNLPAMDKLSFTPAVESVDIDDFPSYSTPLANRTYYWRVDCYDVLTGEPNLPGVYWNFTTTSAPVIVQQTTPETQAKFPGETAEFTVEFSAASLTYTWYRSVDNANNTPGDDVVVGGDSDTLTLTDLTVGDEGWYYCKAVNPEEARSNPARLSIKQLYAHWALDGNADDSSDNNLHGTLFGNPVFDAGAVSQAMVFDGADDYIREPNDFADFIPGITISVWAKPTSIGSYARFIDFGNGSASDNICLSRSGTTNDLSLILYVGSNNVGTITAANAITLNEWQMFIATMDESGDVVLYKNGLPVQTGTITQKAAVVTRTSNFIGESNWAADALYAGLMDDIYIYNYAKSADDVADMYSAVAGNFCRTRPEYDWDDSCKVDLGDCALLAAQWLACGLYPDCP